MSKQTDLVDFSQDGTLNGTGDLSLGNATLTGYLRGPATFTIDPAVHGNNSGLVVIAGNLQVDGTQTTINSTTMDVDDLNITVAKGAANAAAANGAGLTVDGASATLTYVSGGDNWAFNKNLAVAGLLTTNGELQVNGTGSVAVFEATDGAAYIQIKDDDGTSGFIGVDAGKMVFQTPGSSFSSKLVITSTGNVGIGEAAPANLLHVKASDTGIAPHGSAQIVLEREGTNYLQFLTAENGTSGILFGDGSDVDVSKIYVDHNTTKMTFVNEASETMTLNGNKVGIGTVTPDLTLDVTHATAAQYIATFQNTGSNLQLKLGCEAVGYLNIQGARIDNGNPYNLSLQADGSNVGIGITVTDSKLHIKGAASNGIAGLVKIQQTPTHSYSPSSFIGPGRSLDLMTASNSNADSSGIRFANPGGSRETFIGVVQTGGQGDLVIQGYNGSAYGERFRVKADGSIGINNTAPAASISIGTDNAYVQEWEKAKGFKRHDTGVSGANGNYNISTYINVQSYRGLCVDYYESGHYFNNGAAYYFRHSKIYVILEGSTLRVGDVVLVRSTGNRTDAIVNAPSIAVSASGQFTITSTILSGFAHYVSVDVSGSGFISIGAIG